jgi:hypothetical protein
MQAIAASVVAQDTGDFLDAGACGRNAPAMKRARCMALAHDHGQGRALIAEALATGTPATDELHMARAAL